MNLGNPFKSIPGRIRSAPYWRAWLAGLFVLSALHAAERLDVFYLRDYLKETVELKVLNQTPITFSRDGNGVLGSLHAGQRARLVGVGTDRYLVNAQTLDGRVEGWVLMSDLEPIPEAIRKELEKKSRESEKLKEAIAQRDIEVGLPQEAVLKILGKPNSKSSIKDATGSYEQWTYNAYKTVYYYVPTTTLSGTNAISTFYHKAVVGSQIITFQEKKVIRIETKEDDKSATQGGTIVIPPVYVQ